MCCVLCSQSENEVSGLDPKVHALCRRKDVVKLNLVSVGNNKIKVIKVISEDLGYSLNDAKTIVDNAPTELEVDPEKVEKLIEDLESAGANVSYSQSDAGSLTTLETSILSDEVGTQVLSEEFITYDIDSP